MQMSILTKLLNRWNSMGGHAQQHAGMGVPTKRGLFVALLGNSITRNNNWDGSASTTKFSSQLGYWTHAAVLTKKRFICPPSNNFGVFGETTAQILARVNQVIAVAPDICVVEGGTNDLSSDIDAATIVGNLVSIWTALTKAGISVVATTILPRSFNMTASRSRTLLQANNLIRRAAASMRNVYLWDSFQNLANQSGLLAECNSALYADDLHPNRTGAYWMGYDLAQVLNSIFPQSVPCQYQCISGGDLYDATYAPNGNKLTNAMLAGTGGTNVGAYATGSVATGYSVYRGSGTTITCVSSKGTATTVSGQSYATQILTVSSPGGGAATEEIAFFQNATCAVGDNVVAGADISVASISGRLNYVTPRTQAQYGSYNIIGQGAYYAAGGAQGLPAAFSGHDHTVPGVTPSGGTSVQAAIVVGLDCTVASSVQVTIALPYLRIA